MATRLVLNSWKDWLLSGSPSDTRLLHADVSDRILVFPPDLSQGYFQEILLPDDLFLYIHDYSLNRDLMTDVSEGDRLEFDFPIVGSGKGYGFVVPYFGWKNLAFRRAKKRFFKVEIFFKRPTLHKYLQAFMERLSPQTRSTAEKLIRLMYCYHGGGSSSTPVGMLNRIFDRSNAQDSHFIFEQVANKTLYFDALDLSYATCRPVTPIMQQLMGQILSCPYQGTTRRTYLEQKALQLVSLRLEAMGQPQSTKFDLSCIYQAAAILRKDLINPPTVQALARQVGTNRLYLNKGFAQVYGTTPYGYLRSCRMWYARRLLMTSDLSISDVATEAGYSCRSHFAIAFRQLTGMNPKAFQMTAWQRAS
ncbi:MAG: helix-turn-helix transcriptional regulator [Cyanobacteria bacterium P01_C01_bin.118]